MSERVLVTGATGFVGSHLARRLVKMDYDVFIFKRKNSDTWRLSDIANKLKTHDVDLQNFSEVKKVVNAIKPKIVFHLAAYGTNQKERDTSTLINANIFGTINLLNSFDKNALSLFVNTGTWWEYGNSREKISEEHALNPFNEYAVTKIAANYFCKTLYNSQNYPISIIKPFQIFGTYEDANRLIPSVIISSTLKKNIPFSGGKQKRDFIFVEDLIDAYIATIDNEEAVGEIFNIGSGVDYSIQETVMKILKIMESSERPQFGVLPYRKNEIMKACANISKARKILKWKPNNSLDSGLKTTINWFKDNLAKYTDNHG